MQELNIKVQGTSREIFSGHSTVKMSKCSIIKITL